MDFIFSVNITTPFLAIFAGVFIYIGLQHLFVGFVSNKRALNVSFGLFTLFLASFQLSLVCMEKSNSVISYLLAYKVFWISLKAACIARMIYVTLYTKIMYKKIVYTYVFVNISLIIIILFSRTGYLFDKVTGIVFVKSYFNETTTYLTGSFSKHIYLDLILNMVLYIHTFVVLIQHYFKTRKKFTLFLLLVFVELFISQVYTYLTLNIIFDSIFYQFGYLILTLGIAIALISEYLKFSQAETKIQLHEQFSKTKEDITHMIVHDLKIPLNMLLNIRDDLPKDELINMVSSFTRKMEFQVLDILDIYNTDNFVFKINKDRWDLNEIIENAIENVNFFIKQKNIFLVYDNNFKCFVSVDGRIIERVITNLLSNSVKYSQNNGFIKVLVSIVNANSVEIKIIDNGIGIEKTKLAIVFNKFEAINKQNNEIIQSSGMGLAFCKMAVEAHGGRIFIDSVVSEGTTVSFSLSLIHDFL